MTPEPTDRLARWQPLGPPRTVFRHRWFATIVEEDLRLPDGTELSWLRYTDARDGVEHDHPDGVMALCLRGDRLLLARQYNPGADRVVWELPGGGAHPGESYEDAMRRELMEEVGLCPRHLRYAGRVLVDNRRSSFGLRTYIATDLEDRLLPCDDGELIESSWFRLTKVDAMVRSGEIDNSTLLSGLALLRAAEPVEGP